MWQYIYNRIFINNAAAGTHVDSIYEYTADSF
jgi:hypothetical protein